MKSLVESILSSTKTGTNSYSFLWHILSKLKETYPGLKLINNHSEYKTMMYIVCKADELKKHLTERNIKDIKNLMDEYADLSLYESKFIKGHDSCMCSLVDSKYLYTLLTVEYIVSDRNVYRTMSSLSVKDNEFGNISEGDLVISCTKDDEYIDEKTIKELEKIFS